MEKHISFVNSSYGIDECIDSKGPKLLSEEVVYLVEEIEIGETNENWELTYHW